MSPKTTRRRRDDETPAEPTPSATPPVVPPPSPEPEILSELPHQRLDFDELEALASMDPSELAALMEGNLGHAHKIEVGDEISGTVTRIGKEDVFVDVGAKAEATIQRLELPQVQIGDTVTAYVLNTEGEWRLSNKLTGAAAAAHLEAAVDAGIPVEGRVMSRNKGGYTVRVGSISAFCPISLISRIPLDDPDSVLDQTLTFKVLESGDKVVLSRRALQQEEAERDAEKLWETIQVDDVYTGIVRNVQPFGAFVDIQGVDGLVPRRELSWDEVSDPTTVVRRGQSLGVRVLAVDRDKRKITLTVRDPSLSPWEAVGTRFFEGGVYPGTVARVAEFGAFIALAPGLQGLAHTSRLPNGIPAVGSEVQVRLMGVDLERQRLDLAVVEGEGAVAEEGGVGTTVKGTASEVLRNGVAVQLEDGRRGWLPAGEVELPPGTMLAQRFRRGRAVEARIKRIDGDRITLSQKPDEGAERATWQRALSVDQSGGLGTLADLLGKIELK